MSVHPHRSGKWLTGAVLGLFAAIAILGMLIPRTVPRLAFLPAPPTHYFCDKTFGGSLQRWHRAGAVWASTTTSNSVTCGSRSN
jgi:hypothetical protein